MGISMGVDGQGKVFAARFMGGPDQCLEIKLPLTEDPVWCTLPWPHEGEHDFSGRSRNKEENQ